MSLSAFPLIVHHSERDSAALINCSLFIVPLWLTATSYSLPLSPYQHSGALPQTLKRPLLNLSLSRLSPSSSLYPYLWAAILLLTLSASSLSLFWQTSGRDFTAFTQSIAVTSLLCSSQQNCKHFPSLSLSPLSHLLVLPLLGASGSVCLLQPCTLGKTKRRSLPRDFCFCTSCGTPLWRLVLCMWIRVIGVRCVLEVAKEWRSKRINGKHEHVSDYTGQSMLAISWTWPIEIRQNCMRTENWKGTVHDFTCYI